MGITKTNLFTAQQNELASLCKVLGHPARIAILQQILSTQSCICGDLVEEIGLAQATISQHLKELKYAGIIKGEIEGRSVCYCIDEQNWSQLQITLSEFLNQALPSNECC